MSVRDSIRTGSRRWLTRLGALPLAFFAWRLVRDARPAVLLRNRSLRRAQARSGTQLPPARLIYSVTGSRDVQWFMESGARSAAILRAAFERAGRPLDTMERVLDMGCGCGRVLRHWEGERTVQFYGTDYNPAGPRWVRENLTYVQADTNELAPPLRYPDNFFDAIYAISVFTHLPEELQRPWMDELSRVLKPGGILLATLLGEGFLSRFTASEAARFRKGDLVVIDANYAGTNMCSALHSEPYVRGEWSAGFEILDKSPHDIGGPLQDLWTFREARKAQ